MAVGVVYLARRASGIDALARFLASYRAHDAGADHELILLMKGFAPADEKLARVVAAAPSHRALSTPDEGFDVGSYLLAARTLDYRFLCFLNSHTRILADDWLAKLLRPVRDRTAALAGASGSYTSLRSLGLYRLHLPTPYARVLPDRRRAEDELLLLELAQSPESPRARWSRGRRRFEDVKALRHLLRGFGTFPAPHVRTNAFLVERELYLHACRRPAQGKIDAWRFESGLHGLTTAAAMTGRPPVVVGADGQEHLPARWPESRTFWQGDQENLLVADNQTRLYDEGDVGRRELLARLAWGPEARPAPPRSASACL